MARTESMTTTVVRQTMDMPLDDVNDKLTEADQPELTEEQLTQRRIWVRTKAARDGVVLSTNGHSNGHSNGQANGRPYNGLADAIARAAVPADDSDDSDDSEEQSVAKGEIGKTARGQDRVRKKKRVPRAGTQAEFVCSVPFDLPAEQVWKMSLEAGHEGTLRAVSGARWKYGNLRKRFGKNAAKTFSAADRAEAIKLGRARRIAAAAGEAAAPQKRATKPQSTTSVGAVVSPLVVRQLPPVMQPRPDDSANTAAARAQLANVIMGIGLDLAEEVMMELRSIKDRFTLK